MANAPEVTLSTDFQTRLMVRKRISPDGALAPFHALFLAFVGLAHGLPGDPFRMARVFRRSLPSLLMNQVEIVESRFPAYVSFKQRRLAEKFVAGRNRIVAGIGNVSGAIFGELVIAQLEQPDVRSRTRLGIETGTRSWRLSS